MKIAINGEILEVSGGGLPEGAVPVMPLTKAEYDALTDEEKQADVVYAITDDGGSSGGGSGGTSEEVYSTEETRIGAWIDGKPLYRKVVYVPVSKFVNPPSPTMTRSLDDIAPESIDKLISFSGVVDEATMQLPINFHFASSAYLDMQCLEPSSRSVEYVGSDLVLSSANGVYLLFEYTKTTDTGGTL